MSARVARLRYVDSQVPRSQDEHSSGRINVLLILSLDFFLGFLVVPSFAYWVQVDLTRPCLRACSVGIILNKWSTTHRRLRGARLAVRAATAAVIVLGQLAATSLLLALTVGCGPILGLRPSRASRKTLFLEVLCLAIYTFVHSGAVQRNLPMR